MTLLRTGGLGQEPVAIIGIGCRFPGAVVDPASFWRLLLEARDAIVEIPSDRIALDRYFDPSPATPGRMMTRWGGFLDRIQEFDADFFGIAPREAERMDPQQRVLLEVAWEALEDAAQDIHRLEGSPTGVFVGQWVSDYEARLFADPAAVDFYMTTGTGRYSTSGRISYALGFRGASLTVDTACSSSLAAVHLAVRSVRSGESSLALAAGVNLILQPHINIAYSQSGMMAPDGRCKFGDASADGYVRSEGVGCVVLKSLTHALADGDRIYAVIRGSAVNNDGRSSGSMGTPSRLGQEELLRRAYADAAVDPAQVHYVEAHGTGTRVGDPIELGALASVLGPGRAGHDRALVGSVKTNIGHTEGAAGIAGLIKVALALHHGLIPASLHCRQTNPAIPWGDLPVELVQEATAWPREAGKTRVAGVSAFGIAGTNAHVVLEDMDDARADVAAPSFRPDHLLPLSARSPHALRALAGRYAEDLTGNGELALEDVCWSAATGRTALDHRAVFVAADAKGLVDALRGFATGAATACEGIVRAEAKPRVAFVCPGQGAQWVGMGRQLAATEPVFREALARCDAAARHAVEWSILEQIEAEPGSHGYRLDQIDVIQPVLTALAIAYAALLRAWGVEPDALVGHSMGEVAAAHIAGAIDLEQAMRIVSLRSALMGRARGQGAMALVDLPTADVQARLAGLEDRVTIAVNNSPRSTVVSGDAACVQHLVGELEQEGIFCRLIKVDVASHSPQMEPFARELASRLEGLVPADATCSIYSTVLARRADGAELGAGYWGSNLRQPVRFADTVRRMLADGITLFIELGPHPVLLPSIQQTASAEGREVSTIALGQRDQPEPSTILGACGTLWTSGFPVDWHKVLPAARRTDLPLYPWQRERYWLDSADLMPAVAGTRVTTTPPDDESREWLHQFTWTAVAPPAVTEHAAGRWLVLTDDPDFAISDAIGRRGGMAATASLASLEPAIERHRVGDELLKGIVLCVPSTPDAAYLPIRAVQSMLTVPGRSHPRLWCVTRGAQPASPRARVSVDQAAAWGTGRVLAEEHPDLWGGLVDLDPDDTSDADADLIVAQLLASDGEQQVAFRGHARLALRLAAVASDSPVPPQWRADASYLITGGLGDIGLHIARAMAARGARRLILLGRTPLPPRHSWSTADPQSTVGKRIAAVRDLESSGVAVHLACVDLSDEAQLRQFLELFAAEGWPPIRGVVHAAAELDNHLAAEMTRADFERVLGSKLHAALSLDRLLPNLDLFVTFSSIVAYVGQVGEANYAAANAGLDALAHDRRARGLPAVSIGWGVWLNTGFASGEAGERVTSELNRQGIHPFSPDRGTRLFDWLCGHPHPTVAVLPIDWATFHRARNGRGLPLYRELIDVAPSAQATQGNVDEWLSRLGITERREMLRRVVRDTVCRVLKVAPAKLDERKSLGNMGLTSLLAMELRNRLEAALGRSLSATLAWNYPTVTALADYLAGDGGGEKTSVAQRPPVPLDPANLPDVLALSDEEAALALRGGVTRSHT